MIYSSTLSLLKKRIFTLQKCHCLFCRYTKRRGGGAIKDDLKTIVVAARKRSFLTFVPANTKSSCFGKIK